jgi:threonine dehydratase
MNPPVFADVLRARQIIDKYLPSTPLVSYASLDELVGLRLLIKHENQQPTGAFKVRGGINLLSELSSSNEQQGVISASTGNHGQSIAYAAQLFNVPATIVVPEHANALKVEAIKHFGANIVVHGKDFDEAREHCEQLALAEGLRYIHSGNEPLLIAGVGTLTYEMLAQAPETDVIIVPVGGGSGAAAACLVAKTLKPELKVIGVQSEAAPAAYKSWLAKKLLTDVMETEAEGLATRVAFQLPQQMMWQMLDDFVLVSEDEIRSAVAIYRDTVRTFAEGAGAAPLAAAIKLRPRWEGQTIALVLSGGNITPAQLRRAH